MLGFLQIMITTITPQRVLQTRADVQDINIEIKGRHAELRSQHYRGFVNVRWGLTDTELSGIINDDFEVGTDIGNDRLRFLERVLLVRILARGVALASLFGEGTVPVTSLEVFWMPPKPEEPRHCLRVCTGKRTLCEVTSLRQEMLPAWHGEIILTVTSLKIPSGES